MAAIAFITPGASIQHFRAPASLFYHPPSQQPHTHPLSTCQMPATLPLILQTDLLLDVIPQACQLRKPYHPTPCQSPNSNLFQQLAFCLPECMRCASPITPYSSECRWVRAGPGHDAAPTRCRWWSTYPAHKGKVAFTHLCAGGMLGQHSSQGVPVAVDLRGVGN